jgi:hypothetical protein
VKSMDPSNLFARINRRIDGVVREVRELRSALGTLGAATISGDLKVKSGGSVSVLDGGNIFLSQGGKFFVAGDDTYVQILEDSFSIGTMVNGAFGRPSMIMQPDGFLAAISDTQYAVFRVDAVDGAAVVTSSTGVVRLPWMPTGAGANTRILNDGTIQMVTSSLRYKQDPQDAEVDPADVLKLQGRTWRQRSEVEADPDTQVRYVGFIAEELDELETMRQFVEYDDQGRPDAIQYDRLTVALLELAKSQQVQLDGLASRVAALEDASPPIDDDQE